jgi:hypothetical protein
MATNDQTAQPESISNTRGRSWMRQPNGKPVRSRAFLLHYMYLPEPPLLVLHRCHNPCCINPAHLKPGT